MRICRRRCNVITIVLFLNVFLIYFMVRLNNNDSSSQYEYDTELKQIPRGKLAVVRKYEQALAALVKHTNSSQDDNNFGPTLLTKNSSHANISTSRNQSVNLELNDIHMQILNRNRLQYIRNVDEHGLHLGISDTIFLIQVHKRYIELQCLINSLRVATDINKVLLIFSHDYFDTEINKLIENITFAPVLQIFYPYSIQTHPDEFPGTDPKDCSPRIKRAEAIGSGCQNALNPDKYGHYRDAKYTQLKHHWFWKVNRVMDGLRATAAFEGHIVLLEEDHYVAPDVIPTFDLSKQFASQHCIDCSVITLGRYEKKPQFMHSDKVASSQWFSSYHNMGMAFNRTLWTKIKNCAEKFCSFDDYNWDWSMAFIVQKCFTQHSFRSSAGLVFTGGIKVLFFLSPRVFHIGQCGMHAKGKSCDPLGLVRSIDDLLRVSRDRLYPTSLAFGAPGKLPRKLAPKPNGGWGDPRDQQLCLSFLVHPSSQPATLYNATEAPAVHSRIMPAGS